MDRGDFGQSYDMEGPSVRVLTPAGDLEGNLTVPEGARGLVLFAHGSGSSRLSPRNRYVAGILNQSGLATLLFDLLTSKEEEVDARTGHLRFDVDMLADRLVGATHWVTQHPGVARLSVGYFGASTGAGAALVAAARLPDMVTAVVSRGGRPDLAGPALAQVRAPTMLIVGEDDPAVVDMNRDAMQQMSAYTRLHIVPGASHLFEEPGTLQAVADLAADWFLRYLSPSAARGRDWYDADDRTEL